MPKEHRRRFRRGRGSIWDDIKNFVRKDVIDPTVQRFTHPLQTLEHPLRAIGGPIEGPLLEHPSRIIKPVYRSVVQPVVQKITHPVRTARDLVTNNPFGNIAAGNLAFQGVRDELRGKSAKQIGAGYIRQGASALPFIGMEDEPVAIEGQVVLEREADMLAPPPPRPEYIATTEDIVGPTHGIRERTVNMLRGQFTKDAMARRAAGLGLRAIANQLDPATTFRPTSAETPTQRVQRSIQQRRQSKFDYTHNPNDPIFTQVKPVFRQMRTGGISETTNAQLSSGLPAWEGSNRRQRQHAVKHRVGHGRFQRGYGKVERDPDAAAAYDAYIREGMQQNPVDFSRDIDEEMKKVIDEKKLEEFIRDTELARKEYENEEDIEQPSLAGITSFQHPLQIVGEQLDEAAKEQKGGQLVLYQQPIQNTIQQLQQSHDQDKHALQLVYDDIKSVVDGNHVPERVQRQLESVGASFDEYVKQKGSPGMPGQLYGGSDDLESRMRFITTGFSVMPPELLMNDSVATLYLRIHDKFLQLNAAIIQSGDMFAGEGTQDSEYAFTQASIIVDYMASRTMQVTSAMEWCKTAAQDSGFDNWFDGGIVEFKDSTLEGFFGYIKSRTNDWIQLFHKYGRELPIIPNQRKSGDFNPVDVSTVNLTTDDKTSVGLNAADVCGGLLWRYVQNYNAFPVILNVIIRYGGFLRSSDVIDHGLREADVDTMKINSDDVEWWQGLLQFERISGYDIPPNITHFDLDIIILLQLASDTYKIPWLAVLYNQLDIYMLTNITCGVFLYQAHMASEVIRPKSTLEGRVLSVRGQLARMAMFVDTFSVMVGRISYEVGVARFSMAVLYAQLLKSRLLNTSSQIFGRYERDQSRIRQLSSIIMQQQQEIENMKQRTGQRISTLLRQGMTPALVKVRAAIKAAGGPVDRELGEGEGIDDYLADVVSETLDSLSNHLTKKAQDEISESARANAESLALMQKQMQEQMSQSTGDNARAYQQVLSDLRVAQRENAELTSALQNNNKELKQTHDSLQQAREDLQAMRDDSSSAEQFEKLSAEIIKKEEQIKAAQDAQQQQVVELRGISEILSGHSRDSSDPIELSRDVRTLVEMLRKNVARATQWTDILQQAADDTSTITGNYTGEGRLDDDAAMKGDIEKIAASKPVMALLNDQLDKLVGLRTDIEGDLENLVTERGEFESSLMGAMTRRDKEVLDQYNSKISILAKKDEELRQAQEEIENMKQNSITHESLLKERDVKLNDMESALRDAQVTISRRENEIKQISREVAVIQQELEQQRKKQLQVEEQLRFSKGLDEDAVLGYQQQLADGEEKIQALTQELQEAREAYKEVQAELKSSKLVADQTAHKLLLTQQQMEAQANNEAPNAVITPVGYKHVPSSVPLSMNPIHKALFGTVSGGGAPPPVPPGVSTLNFVQPKQRNDDDDDWFDANVMSSAGGAPPPPPPPPPTPPGGGNLVRPRQVKGHFSSTIANTINTTSHKTFGGGGGGGPPGAPPGGGGGGGDDDDDDWFDPNTTYHGGGGPPAPEPGSYVNVAPNNAGHRTNFFAPWGREYVQFTQPYGLVLHKAPWY